MGEFYGLCEDPLELRTLWNDGAARGQRQVSMAVLARAMLEAADHSPYPSAVA